jgi:hypothetical protein
MDDPWEAYQRYCNQQDALTRGEMTYEEYLAECDGEYTPENCEAAAQLLAAGFDFESIT